ncbi:hypothetical protein [Brucella gallinifaecis]|uniref:hypothetical protein n=1 Tax=Brucella gallinifaecis TaxID=215590 RepID=UPI00387E9274
MGCDPGGLKSKIPVIVDAEGGPIYLCLSVEQLADCSQTDDLTECIKEGGITTRYNQRPHNLLAAVKQIAVPSGAPLFESPRQQTLNYRMLSLGPGE